jgi:hypothetical protein
MDILYVWCIHRRKQTLFCLTLLVNNSLCPQWRFWGFSDRLFTNWWRSIISHMITFPQLFIVMTGFNFHELFPIFFVDTPGSGGWLNLTTFEFPGGHNCIDAEHLLGTYSRTCCEVSLKRLRILIQSFPVNSLIRQRRKNGLVRVHRPEFHTGMVVSRWRPVSGVSSHMFNTQPVFNFQRTKKQSIPGGTSCRACDWGTSKKSESFRKKSNVVHGGND